MRGITIRGSPPLRGEIGKRDRPPKRTNVGHGSAELLAQSSTKDWIRVFGCPLRKYGSVGITPIRGEDRTSRRPQADVRNQRDNFRCPPRAQDLEPALYRHRLRKQFGKSARTRDATGPAKQRVASRITPKRALPIRLIGAPAFRPGNGCKDQPSSKAPIIVTLSNRRWMTTDVNVHIRESPKLFSKIRPGRIPQSRRYDRSQPVAARGNLAAVRWGAAAMEGRMICHH
jgi:hypothetical protein